MRKYWSLLAGVVAVMAARVEAGPIQPGAVEASIHGTHVSSSYSLEGEEQGSGSITILGIGIGYFSSEVLELEGGLAVTRNTLSPNDGQEKSSHSVNLLAGVTFNVPTRSHIVPFFSAGGGLSVYGGDDFGDERGFILPYIGIGVRALVSSAASVNIGLGYQRNENQNGVEDMIASAFTASVGMSLYFLNDE